MNRNVIATAAVAALTATAAAARGQQRLDPGPGTAATAAAAAAAAAATAATSPSSSSSMSSVTVPADTWQLRQENGGSLYQAAQAPVSGSAGGAGGLSGAEAERPDWDVLAQPAPHPRVFKKHDLLNIVVREQSTSASGGTSDQQRQVDFDAKVDNFVRFKAASLSLYPASGQQPEVKLEGQRDFKGTGEYDRTDTMTTRLEAEVIDVKPNQTMVIQARRHMQIDEEVIDVTLTGVCRVRDVDADNSVLSTDLHDLDLEKKTTGQVHDTTKRGLLHQILDLLNPF